MFFDPKRDRLITGNLLIEFQPIEILKQQLAKIQIRTIIRQLSATGT